MPEPYRLSLAREVRALCRDPELDPASVVLAEIICRLNPLLPELIELAERVGPNDFPAFRAAVNESICSQCSCQDAIGVCSRRENGTCPLSTYLPLLYSACPV